MNSTQSRLKLENFPALDGIRVIMTFWVVCFHTVWSSAMFLNQEEFDTMFSSPNLKFLSSGLNAVDIFFILTGFLLAYPIFSGKRTGSWSSFVWLRVTRVYPVYIASIIFFCFVLHKGGTMDMLSWDKHVSRGIYDILLETTGIVPSGLPNNCVLSPFNVLFLNNLVPFGGCMGWTWSLCVQVFFYVIFPVIIRMFGTGKKLMAFFGICTLWIFIQRYYIYSNVMLQYGQPQMYLFDKNDLEKFFMFFNIWYSSTFQRLGGIFAGVIVAWIHVNIPSIAEKLHKSLLLQSLLFISAVPGFYMSFVHNFDSAIHNTLFTVGAPVWLYSISTFLYMIIHGFGPIYYLKQFLSHPIMSWLAVPTYPIYLLHSAIIIRVYDWGWSTPIYPLTTYGVVHACTIVLILSYIYGIIVHNLVEIPVKNWLRSSNSKPTLTIEKTVDVPSDEPSLDVNNGDIHDVLSSSDNTLVNQEIENKVDFEPFTLESDDEKCEHYYVNNGYLSSEHLTDKPQSHDCNNNLIHDVSSFDIYQRRPYSQHNEENNETEPMIKPIYSRSILLKDDNYQ